MSKMVLINNVINQLIYFIIVSLIMINVTQSEQRVQLLFNDNIILLLIILIDKYS